MNAKYICDLKQVSNHYCFFIISHIMISLFLTKIRPWANLVKGLDLPKISTN